MTDTIEALLSEIDKIISEPGDLDEAQAFRLMLVAQRSILVKLLSLSVKVNLMWPFYQASKWLVIIVGASFVGLMFMIFTGQVTLTFN